MKKNLKVLCTAVAMGCLMAFPSFAAETKSEYKEDVAPIRNEMKELETQMKPLREENKASAARYKAIRLEKKESGTLSVSKETWKKAREIHQQITAVRKSAGNFSGKALREEAKAAVKEGNYDKALQTMEEILAAKKAREKTVTEINQIWQQIDELLAGN